MAETKRLTWATIDISDPEQREALHRQMDEEAKKLAKEAIAEGQRLGILDANGRRIRKDLPPDMREDSGCDMAAL
jgi:hypothetical protein